MNFELFGRHLPGGASLKLPVNSNRCQQRYDKHSRMSHRGEISEKIPHATPLPADKPAVVPLAHRLHGRPTAR